MYVRVSIEQGVEQSALTVPQQAVQRDANGNAQLYVVGKDNVAELRTVKLGRTTGTRTIVADGLKSGDHVVVEGFQKIRPGVAVTAEEWKPAGVNTSSAESKASAG
jgi:membrane fusion protein (multidrug efflux system)